MENSVVSLGNYAKGEEKAFSIIEAYPYLSYGEGQESNENDLSKLFQVSLDSKQALVNIHVRSREAQNEVSSFLIGHGFDELKCLEGEYPGMTECIKPVEDLDEDEILEEPRGRRYYTEASKVEDLHMSRSTLSISVSFDVERLVEFKRTLKKLRREKSYRNKWLMESGQYMIK